MALEAERSDGPVDGVDELGAHVSVAGGIHLAPTRAREIGARTIQIFTKQPNRWAERRVDEEEARRFRGACADADVRWAGSHDSYLINLASPDPALFQRSVASFRAEVERCEALGLQGLVTHPGNTIDGDTDRGIRQNARAIADVLDDVPGGVRVLLEGTAGTGSALGASFQELGRMLRHIADRHPQRIGVCLDTCHLWATGYDLRDLDRVLEAFERDVGLQYLRLLHLNDSATHFGSRRDRHADIGAGTIGDAPFAALLRHPDLRAIPKVIETPKGDDAVAADRANLARLRDYRRKTVKKEAEPRKE